MITDCDLNYLRHPRAAKRTLVAKNRRGNVRFVKWDDPQYSWATKNNPSLWRRLTVRQVKEWETIGFQ